MCFPACTKGHYKGHTILDFLNGRCVLIELTWFLLLQGRFSTQFFNTEQFILIHIHGQSCFHYKIYAALSEAEGLRHWNDNSTLPPIPPQFFIDAFGQRHAHAHLHV
jgi:hypothetical protein